MFANWALSTHTATYVAVWPYVRRAVFRTRPFQIIGAGTVTLGTTEGIRQPPPITNPGYWGGGVFRRRRTLIPAEGEHRFRGWRTPGAG